jgi:predicted nuclease of restriction endonuclease-like RecB superfamily
MKKKKLRTRNKFEERIYKALRRAKIDFGYESLRLLYVLARHYIPDFIIKTPTGKIYVECKGYLRPADRQKLVAVKKCNPRIDLRLLFYERRKTNINWANKVGFRYAIGNIPKEWLDGL